ncbi:unnamed protein product, partial [Ectocarpus sp. 12 AP-2014]
QQRGGVGVAGYRLSPCWLGLLGRGGRSNTCPVGCLDAALAGRPSTRTRRSTQNQSCHLTGNYQKQTRRGRSPIIAKSGKGSR